MGEIPQDRELLQPTPAGYRITTVSDIGAVNPHAIERIELDASGAMIGAAVPVGAVSSNAMGVPSVLSLADRSLFALPYDVTGNPYQLRLIQTCP